MFRMYISFVTDDIFNNRDKLIDGLFNGRNSINLVIDGLFNNGDGRKDILIDGPFKSRKSINLVIDGLSTSKRSISPGFEVETRDAIASKNYEY